MNLGPDIMPPAGQLVNGPPTSKGRLANPAGITVDSYPRYTTVGVHADRRRVAQGPLAAMIGLRRELIAQGGLHDLAAGVAG
jgi:hypothetical protein